MDKKRSEIKTRQKVNCVIFGAPQNFSELVLPTYEDVMKFYLFVKQELKHTPTSKEPTVSEIGETIATKLEDLWIKASIPVVTRARIMQMIRTYHDKYRNLLKSSKGKAGRESYQRKVETFKRDSKKLFDIAACKCKNTNTCTCSRDRKVPIEERPFLLDQRCERKMMIGSIDIQKTKQLTSSMKRKWEDETRILKQAEKFEPVPSTSQEFVSSETESTASSNSQHSLSPDKLATKRRKINAQMRMQLTCLAKACDRTGVSDRTAATIASAVLEDVGIIKESDKDHVIDRMKIRRQRRKARSSLQTALMSKPLKLRGLYFDGRKDKTLTQERTGSKHYRKIITEEHYTLIQEPGSEYIGHISPNSGSAEDITASISTFICSNVIDTSNLSAVGCDGTAINTGSKGGVIRRLELKIGRPLQWFVCQLHANELPLRHLFHHLDGATTGPKSFSGLIGKQIDNHSLTNLPVDNFEQIIGNLPVLSELNDLSTDQKYLYEMCQAIESGHCSAGLAKRNPGKMSHARWLTTANRVLRLYISTKEPSHELKTLTTYILKVYAPLWFSIKVHSSCKDGAQHLWKTVKLSRYLSEDLKNIIDPVIQRNGYFAHPENILLAMISDERQHIRELGIRRILKARTQAKGKQVRLFNIPKINFNADDYYGLVDWTRVTEPPLTMHISDEELKNIIHNNQADALIDFPRFPCHTQAVERCVKLVTEAAAAVCGADARHGFILSRLDSRRIMPSFSTKCEYKTTL